ncbi:MAG: sensor histidine kinase, partial [Owenweeksia sp.]
AMTALAILVIVIFRLAIRRVMQERERMRRAELLHQQKLLYNSINTQERERQRIAADLHDELSSRLSILKLNLYQWMDGTSKIPEPISSMLDETIRLSRNIAHDLYPPLLAELGLAETLKDYLIPLQGKIETDIYINQNGEAPSGDICLQLFRISQEVIQNMLKHAEASVLHIHLKIRSACTVLLLKDNGKGFDLTNARGGLGLGNIESRIQLLNGVYRIKSSPGKGTSTLILIPHG